MRRIAIVVSATIGAMLTVVAADAQPLSGQGLQGRTAGGEFRGFMRSERGGEDHIWRFRPDGTAVGVATIRRNVGYGTYQYEIGDTGRWRIEGNRLCVDWPGLNRNFSGCYAVTAQGGDHVRLAGPVPWEGTLSR